MVEAADAFETSRPVSVAAPETFPAGRVEVAMVFGAILIAAVLSFLFIGSKSLWLDEGISVYTSRDWSQMVRLVSTYDINMSLYYFLLHFWLKLGDSEAFIRSLSALFAVACIPLFYILGRQLFGGRTGAIAALLLAVNPFFIEYAQEARSYTLLVLLIILSTYCFVQAVDRQSWRFWAAHGVCTTLGVYAHFFAALVCFTQIMCLPLLGRKRFPWKGAALSMAITGAFLSPMLLFGPLGNALVTWIQPPTWHDLFSFFRVVTGSRPLLLLYFIFCVIGLASLVRRRPDNMGVSPLWRGLSVAMWAVLPPLMTFAFSHIASPLFVNRYLIISLPALALLAAAGISRLARPWMQFVVLSLVFLLSSRGLYWWYAEAKKSDWRGVTAFVQSQAQPHDAVICCWYSTHRVFEYYLHRSGDTSSHLVPLQVAPRIKVGRNSVARLDMALLDRVPATYPRVWLILHADMAFKDRPDRSIIMEMLQSHYPFVSQHDFPSIRVLLFAGTSP